MIKIKQLVSALGAGMLLFSALAFTSCKPENGNPNNGTENGTENGGGSEELEHPTFNYTVPDQYKIAVKHVYETTVDGEDTDKTETNYLFLKCDKGIQYKQADINDIYYKYDDINIGKFSYDTDEDNWTLDAVISGTDYITTINTAFDNLFYKYNTDDYEGLLNKGTTTIAGRTCTKYEYKYSPATGTYSFTYYIDNEYNLCMKYDYSVVLPGAGSTSTVWEVTEFKTSNITLPAATPDYKTQIDNLIAPYVGTWYEVKYDDTQLKYVIISNPRTITITDAFEVTYNGETYKAIPSGGNLYVNDEHVSFTLGLNEDMVFAVLLIDGKYNSQFYLMK